MTGADDGGLRMVSQTKLPGREMVRAFVRVFLLLLLVVPSSAVAQEWQGAEVYPVGRIIDGDTVELLRDGTAVKVRLIGVDTPETVHPQKPVEWYGREASTFLRNLLQGESVFLVYDAQRVDKYGRVLAYLYRAPDGLFVNAEIVRQGYGHAYTVFPFRHMEEFRALEAAAREAQRGLWGDIGQTQTLGSTNPSVSPATVLEPSPAGSEALTVYLTKTGTKYHRDGCRFLAKSKIPVALEEAKRKAGPCKVCKPPR